MRARESIFRVVIPPPEVGFLSPRQRKAGVAAALGPRASIACRAGGGLQSGCARLADLCAGNPRPANVVGLGGAQGGPLHARDPLRPPAAHQAIRKNIHRGPICPRHARLAEPTCGCHGERRPLSGRQGCRHQVGGRPASSSTRKLHSCRPQAATSCSARYGSAPALIERTGQGGLPRCLAADPTP